MWTVLLHNFDSTLVLAAAAAAAAVAVAAACQAVVGSSRTSNTEFILCACMGSRMSHPPLSLGCWLRAALLLLLLRAGRPALHHACVDRVG